MKSVKRVTKSIKIIIKSFNIILQPSKTHQIIKTCHKINGQKSSQIFGEEKHQKSSINKHVINTIISDNVTVELAHDQNEHRTFGRHCISWVSKRSRRCGRSSLQRRRRRAGGVGLQLLGIPHGYANLHNICIYIKNT